MNEIKTLKLDTYNNEENKKSKRFPTYNMDFSLNSFYIKEYENFKKDLDV